MEKIENQVATKVTYIKVNENKCPVCGSKRIQGISRVTGYMSLDERFGSGKSNERKQRLDHTGGHKYNYTVK
jgi:ribonucleoside-triphosphate reductase